ncbi:MAG TPA: AAA family ATPase [Polyangiales bacterium]|nr:AAA family ATPase [Polyangiales bacterium]
MSGLRAVLSHAEWLARRRGQAHSTAHVLLALYARSPAGALLNAHGLGEPELIAALARDAGEPENMLALTLERAGKLAHALGHGHAAALHVLLALLREPRSRAYAVLDKIGVPLLELEQRVTGALLPAASAVGRSGRRVPVHAQTQTQLQLDRPRKQVLVPNAQRALAAETEQRRARARKPSEPAAELAAPPERPTAIAARREPSPQAPTAVPAAKINLLPVVPGVRAKPARVSASASPPHAVAARALELDPERFPLLTSLGRNLCQAAVAGQLDPVLGRDLELEQVLDVLSRRRANNPLLVGPPGVGKTAVVEGLALALARGTATGLGERVVIELPVSALLAGTSVRGALAERLQGVLQEVARADGRVIVFIDEIHGILAHDDGADSIGGALKTALARGELACIGATTEAEYRLRFERDAALCRRFTRIEIGEPEKPAALAILTGLAPRYAAHHGVRYAPEALHAAVELSARFMTERYLPDKAIAVIDQAGARVRRRGGTAVDKTAIAEVISEHSAVPVERLLLRDADALLALEDSLGARVIGQPEAVKTIAAALRKGAAGFRGPRPLGTFLLLGPTGVGKTEMAKAIAAQLFPGSEPVRFDMSELSEPHAVARLFGAPPGYVGHDEGGQLTEAVRKRPYQLVLLDEIEKAHRDVLLALLPLLDEGRLTDGRGRQVDFTNTVVVMTSNLGVPEQAPRARVGFGAGADTDADANAQRPSARNAAAETALGLARQALPPELWNRIDEPLYFHALERADVVRIAQGMLAQVVALVQREHGVRVVIDASTYDALIAAGGYEPSLGARPLRRVIGRRLEAPLAAAVLSGELARGATVVVGGVADRITLTPTSRTPIAAE